MVLSTQDEVKGFIGGKSFYVLDCFHSVVSKNTSDLQAVKQFGEGENSICI